MKHFEPKSYQQDVLNSTRLYFERIHELGKANTETFDRFAFAVGVAVYHTPYAFGSNIFCDARFHFDQNEFPGPFVSGVLF